MEEKIVQILIQGGAVGLCLAIIWYSWKKDQLYNKTLNNHLEHTHQSDKAIAESNVELAKSLTHLADVIKRKDK